jgi:hypothetical protein
VGGRSVLCLVASHRCGGVYVPPCGG